MRAYYVICFNSSILDLYSVKRSFFRPASLYYLATTTLFSLSTSANILLYCAILSSRTLLCRPSLWPYLAALYYVLTGELPAKFGV